MGLRIFAENYIYMKKNLTLFALVLFLNFSAQIDTTGLFAVYNFNTGTAIDGIQPRQNGDLYNSIFTADRFNNLGSAVTFTTITWNSIYNLGTPSKALVTNGLTLSAWIKLSNISGQKAIVAKWAGTMNSDQYVFMVDGNKLRFAVGTPSVSASGILGNISLNANQWYHVAATWDTSGTHKIYVNGVLDVSNNLSAFKTINNFSPTMLSIGGQVETATRYFKGQIDEVLMYRRCLSDLEIQNIYTAPSSIPNGLVSKYTFDNNAIDLQNYNDADINSISYTNNRFGNANAAVDFSTTSYLNLHDCYDLFATETTGKFAYSFWINFKTLNSTYQIIAAKSADAGCSADQRQFLLRVNPSNKLEITSYGSLTSGNYISLVGNTTLTTGQWYHVVMNYDAANTTSGPNSRYELYVNGIQETILAGTPVGSGIGNGILNGPARIAIGAYLSSSDAICANVQRLNAYFDDLHIYNKTLNSTEVTALYNEINTTGITDTDKETEIKVYPNPTNGDLMIELKENADVELLNTLGQIVLNEKLTIGNNNLQITNQNPGVYFVRLKYSNFSKIIKIIKH